MFINTNILVFLSHLQYYGMLASFSGDSGGLLTKLKPIKGPNFLFFISSSRIEIGLHTEFQLPTLPVSGPKVLGGKVGVKNNLMLSFDKAEQYKFVHICTFPIDSISIGIQRKKFCFE